MALCRGVACGVGEEPTWGWVSARARGWTRTGLVASRAVQVKNLFDTEGSRLGQKRPVYEIHLDVALKALAMPMGQFVDLCMLLGLLSRVILSSVFLPMLLGLGTRGHGAEGRGYFAFTDRAGCSATCASRLLP